MRCITPETLSSIKGDDQKLWVYNGLDCVVTRAVWDELQPMRTPHSDLAYNFSIAMQGPAMHMMLRGIRIDTFERAQQIDIHQIKLTRLQLILNQYSHAVWGQDLNAASPPQLKAFFYGALGIPEITKYDKATKSKKVSVDRDALEKLLNYWYASPIARCILRIREVSKVLSVLRSGVDADNRIRTSYNVCGTETWRWSSSENAFGTGTNLQNITNELREIFIADHGKKMAYVDLEQAESRAVAYISGDLAYILACESGDLHTTVCKLVWQDLPWADNLDIDKAIAKQEFYRHLSYRDMAKKGGHGTNYYGKPPTVAKHMKVAVKLVEAFQWKYFSAFPGISRWHTHTAELLQTAGHITTPYGFKRHFFGRRSDDATLREAIAFVPQSLVGVGLNLGLWRVWYYMDLHGQEVECLAQVHDAGLIQYDEAREDELLPRIMSLMEIRVPVKGKELHIPTNAEVGWNWKHYVKGTNNDGIKGYKPGDSRKREIEASTSVLDRILC